MDTEEDKPKKRREIAIGEDLATLSVEELKRTHRNAGAGDLTLQGRDRREAEEQGRRKFRVQALGERHW